MTPSPIMYSMKPLVHLGNVEVNTDMYRLKNLHDGDASDVTCNGTAEDDDNFFNFIEGRQEFILKRLKELKDLLSAPIANTPDPKINSHSSSSSRNIMTLQAIDLNKSGITNDVVLNVNPSQLPYSLLGLARVLPLRISCHSHSSIRALPKPALELQDKLLALSTAAPKGTNAESLHIRLVWKEGDSDFVSIVSPLKSVPIFGEVNFLRFLYNSVAQTLSPVDRTVLDDKLDSCFALSTETNKQNMVSHTKNILSRLNKDMWLMGDAVSVVDLAAWSVITRQFKSIPLDQVGKQWFEKCTHQFSS